MIQGIDLDFRILDLQETEILITNLINSIIRITSKPTLCNNVACNILSMTSDFIKKSRGDTTAKSLLKIRYTY